MENNKTQSDCVVTRRAATDSVGRRLASRRDALWTASGLVANGSKTKGESEKRAIIFQCEPDGSKRLIYTHRAADSSSTPLNTAQIAT